MIPDILDIIQRLFWNYVIDSQTSQAELTELPVLPLWVNTSIDFAKENMRNKLLSWPFATDLLHLCRIDLSHLRKNISEQHIFQTVCFTSCNFVKVPESRVPSRDAGLAADCGVGSWLSPPSSGGYSELDEMWEIPGLIFLEKFSAAVFIGDRDKTEHSAPKHLLAYCGVPGL